MMEKDIIQILSETIDKTLKDMLLESVDESYGEFDMPTYEDFDNDSMETIYRVAFKNQLESIFKYGYDREFTGTKGGNMYGKGVYCTSSLEDTINNVKTKPEYGNIIVKMRLIGGFQKFIIFDENKARETYGDKWKIKSQLSLLFPPDLVEKMVNTISEVVKTGEAHVMHGRTAPCAYAITRIFRKELKEYGIRGVIYKGNRDGNCVVPYDFSAVIPYSVSFDYGRTWIKKFNQETYNRLQNSVDTEFRYQNKYDKTWKPIQGFALVEKDKKYNYLDINNGDKEISPVWFDAATLANPNNGMYTLTYNGEDFDAVIPGFFPNDEAWSGIMPTNAYYEKWFDYSDLPNYPNVKVLS